MKNEKELQLTKVFAAQSHNSVKNIGTRSINNIHEIKMAIYNTIKRSDDCILLDPDVKFMLRAIESQLGYIEKDLEVMIKSNLTDVNNMLESVGLDNLDKEEKIK